MSKKYADVLPDINVESLDRTFEYGIPEELACDISEGSCVSVPFGKGNKIKDGYVFAIKDAPEYDADKIKDIISVVKGSVSVEEKQVALAGWLKKTYGGSMIQALKTVLPVRNKTGLKTKRTIRAAGDPVLYDEYLKRCQEKKFSAKARLLAAVKEEKSIPWEKATGELKIVPSTIRLLEDAGYIKVVSEAVYRTALSFDPDMRMQPVPELTAGQKKVFEGILDEWKKEGRPCLIQGITGSGKTAVYMKLIEKMLEEGSETILLIPEIALTWQTVSRFYACFGDKVAVLHSRLSKAERSDLIRRVEAKEVSLVIGPRSALFTPFTNLGLIIIDEEHENSYRSEAVPRYNAADTAVKKARIEGAKVVMGSATPSVDSRYKCETGEYAFFRLDERYAGAMLPKTRIVDMKEELTKGNRSIISYELSEAMSEKLERKEQIMLFLNRRGHTGFFSCRSCGYVVKCPHCDVSMTMHRNKRLMCHYCGYSAPMLDKCPECGSPYIGGFKAGTEQVEEIVKRDFPQARILRMDRDTTKNRDDYERILKSFAAHEADILIGTQMIVKGHDFPYVTLVGILAADTSLYEGSYRSSERTFQLISQAAGRAGRGDLPGTAIVQTYHPEHYAIQSALSQDYDAFYVEEIEDRKLLGYPPAGHMKKILLSSEDEALAEKAAGYLKKFIESIKKHEDTRVLGPADDQISRLSDKYRKVIYIRDNDINELIRLRLLAEKYIEINKGFSKISVYFDLDE